MEREGGDRVAAREEGAKVAGAPLTEADSGAASKVLAEYEIGKVDLTVPAVATAELLVATS